MVKPFKATETVTTDDGDYTLAIDIGIIDALEDEFDQDFAQLMQQFQGSTRIGKLTRLVRCLLARNHPELDLDDVGALLMAGSEPFAQGMTRLFDKASPDQKAGEGENPPKAHRGTGASSSSSGAPRGSRRASSGSKRLEHSS